MTSANETSMNEIFPWLATISKIIIQITTSLFLWLVCNQTVEKVWNKCYVREKYIGEKLLILLDRLIVSPYNEQVESSFFDLSLSLSFLQEPLLEMGTKVGRYFHLHTFLP